VIDRGAAMVHCLLLIEFEHTKIAPLVVYSAKRLVHYLSPFVLLVEKFVVECSILLYIWNLTKFHVLVTYLWLKPL